MQNYLRFSVLALLILLSTGWWSCTKVDNTEETLKIGGYIDANNLNPIISPNGVYIALLEEGSSEKPSTENASTIIMKFDGKYLDNEVFDKTPEGDSTIVNLNTLIPGLKEGLTYFGRGSKGTIIIPSSLGFGSRPPRGMRKNAVLVFEVHLFDFY